MIKLLGHIVFLKNLPEKRTTIIRTEDNNKISTQLTVKLNL